MDIDDPIIGGTPARDVDGTAWYGYSNLPSGHPQAHRVDPGQSVPDREQGLRQTAQQLQESGCDLLAEELLWLLDERDKWQAAAEFRADGIGELVAQREELLSELARLRTEAHQMQEAFDALQMTLERFTGPDIYPAFLRDVARSAIRDSEIASEKILRAGAVGFAGHGGGEDARPYERFND